jgi:gas vesicle protein
MVDNVSDRAFLVGLFLGAAVGAAVAALLFPRTQVEDEPSAERGLQLRIETEETIQRAEQAANAAVDKVRSNAQQLLGNTPG